MTPDRGIRQTLDDAARDRLRFTLGALVGKFDDTYLVSDPVQFIHRYDDPRDQELVGLIAATLAYGRVAIILKSVGKVLEVLGDSPTEALRRLSPHQLRTRLHGFKHRFNDGNDVALMLHLVGQQLRRYGSLEALFMSGYDPGHDDIGPALSHFVASILDGDPRPLRARIAVKASVRYLLTSPAQGSACKRMLMFLRWMVRRADGVDIGIWQGIDPAKLLVPLDTHVFRIGTNVGLVERKTPDMKASVEMTASLRALSPTDPVQYDFALARLGILDLCPNKRDAVKCAACDLYDVCRLGVDA